MDLHLPPNSIEAEQAALGAALISRRATETLIERLKVADFYAEPHRKVFDAILRLHNQGVVPDVLTVPEVLRDRKQLDAIGGVAYVNTLAETTPTAAHVEHYAEIVAEKSRLRHLIEYCAEATADALRPGTDPAAIAETLQARLYDLGRARGTEPVLLAELLSDVISRATSRHYGRDPVQGIHTGLERLDAMTDGLGNGELIILAGRPSMGKSAAAMQIAVNVAKTGVGVLVFALEMSRTALAMRVAAAESQISMKDVRAGWVAGVCEDRLVSGVERLAKANLWIEDTATMTAAQIGSVARRAVERDGVGLVIIDHLHLVDSPIADPRIAITRSTDEIRRIARTLQIPVLLLAQLSRGVQSREDKRPLMSDLKESGAIEEMADKIWLLFRQSYYDLDAPEPILGRPVDLEFGIAKGRDTGTGRVTVAYDLVTQAIYDLDRHHTDAPPTEKGFCYDS